jgi:hypothetical protein
VEGREGQVYAGSVAHTAPPVKRGIVVEVPASTRHAREGGHVSSCEIRGPARQGWWDGQHADRLPLEPRQLSAVFKRESGRMLRGLEYSCGGLLRKRGGGLVQLRWEEDPAGSREEGGSNMAPLSDTTQEGDAGVRHQVAELGPTRPPMRLMRDSRACAHASPGGLTSRIAFGDSRRAPPRTPSTRARAHARLIGHGA